MIYFGKYEIHDWQINKENNSSYRNILFNSVLRGKISVYKEIDRYLKYHISFDFNNYIRDYTLLSEYNLFYFSQTPYERFVVETEKAAKDKVDTFLIKFNKLKAFV